MSSPPEHTDFDSRYYTSKIRILAQKIKQYEIRKYILKIPKHQNSQIKYTFTTIHSLYHKKKRIFNDTIADLNLLASIPPNQKISISSTSQVDYIALNIMLKRNLPNRAFVNIIKYIPLLSEVKY
ncbi:MAG: hypothetical protein CL512_05510 [Actinobacteria bacterium]|nr:hypothetical protein [Actinomycetota bacterium]